MSLLENVVARFSYDRFDVLSDIKVAIDTNGMFATAKFFDVVDVETFAIEFMTAYNNEVAPIF